MTSEAQLDSALARNVETWDAAFAAVNRRDLEAAVACFHPKVEWHVPDDVSPTPTVLYGHKGVREFFKTIFAAFGQINIELEGGPHPVGDWVVSFAAVRFAGKSSGAQVDQRQTWFGQMQDGLVIYNRYHHDAGRTQEFLEHNRLEVPGIWEWLGRIR